MLKTLLKKQMTEIFRSYFYNVKTNKRRSTASTVFYIILFVILMVGILGGMFTFLALTLCGTMAEKFGWMYFAIFGLLSILLGVFGSVFNTYSGLYLSKDNNLLLSMPVPVNTIMTARLLGVYLMGLMYSAVVIVPAVAVYSIITRPTVLTLLGGLLMIVLISVIVLILSCLLGWVVWKISLKIKNKSFISVIVALAFIGIYYFCYFKAQAWLNDLIANVAVYGNAIRNKANVVYLFGRIGEGDVTAMAVFTLAVAAVFTTVWLIISKSFMKMATSTGKAPSIKYKEKSARQKSTFSAVLGKEFARFTSSPNYMLNCGFGILLTPALGVLLLIYKDTVMQTFGSVFANRPDSGLVLAVAAICMMASMNDMAAPSVSLEGKNIWILQSLPVDLKIVMQAKLGEQIILTVVPIAFTSACAAYAFAGSVLEAAFIIIAPLCFVLMSACFSLFVGIKMPNLTWTNEITPIKQSMGVLLSILVSWGIAVAIAGVYLLLDLPVGATVYLAASGAVMLAASLALYLWLIKKGPKIFASL